MPRIRSVLFDLGGTLVDERDFAGWLELAASLGLDLEADALSHAYLEVEREVDASPPPADREAGIVDFWRRTLSGAAGRDVPLPLVRAFLAAGRADDSPMPLFSDVRRCLASLHEGGRVLGVLSNSSSEERVRHVLEQVGILGYFAAIVVPGDRGAAKPDPEIFHRALDRLGVAAEQALYVGNLARTDAQAAKAAGLHALWLNRDGTGMGDDPPEITSLLEVPLWVRRLDAEPLTPGPRGAR